MAGGWVYIMTNRPDGTLYVGVTADLPRRAWEHRSGAVEGFTKRYGLNVWSTRSIMRIFGRPSVAKGRSSAGGAHGRCG
jgi:hypothetical protein